MEKNCKITIYMRILNPGKINKKTYSGTCAKCSCEVDQVEEKETRWIEDRPRDGARCVICPTCKDLYLWVK